MRFFVTPTGGVISDLEARSELAWPTPLSHRVVGVPGGGSFGVDATIEMRGEVYINIFGLFTGSVPLYTERIELQKTVQFDPLLLERDPINRVQVRVSDPGLVPPFRYDIPVIPGALDMSVLVAVFPEVDAGMHHGRVESSSADVDREQTASGDWALLPIPPNAPSEIGLTSTYSAQIDSVLSMVIEPEVQLSTILGPFSLVSFPIPIELVDSSSEETFATQFYTHPLPAIARPPERLEFGAVPVGGLANRELSLENLGAMDLEGSLRIEGSEVFTVFPETLLAAPGRPDGVVVTFAPTERVPTAARLVIESSDPGVPVVEVDLTGIGLGTAAPEDGTGSVESFGCGCATGGGGASWLALGLPLLALRRSAPAA